MVDCPNCSSSNVILLDAASLVKMPDAPRQRVDRKQKRDRLLKSLNESLGKELTRDG